MRLLLFLGCFTGNITHALTLPLDGNTDALSAEINDKYFTDRTISNIIWSCVATLFACGWIAVHPNIPSENDGEVLVLGRRLLTMVYMLLAPELLIRWAARQHFAAKAIAAKYRGV